MYLFSGLCLVTVIYVLFKFYYKPYSKNFKVKKSSKKNEEDYFKQQILKSHPDFIRLYAEFKKDQEDKRKKGYYSASMISEGGYMTKIYGQYVFVYDEYFENCFYQEIESKYNELKNNQVEFDRILKLIPQQGNYSHENS